LIEIISLVGTWFETRIEKNIEGSGFALAVFVDNEIVEYVIKKGLHGYDYAAFYHIAPRFYKGILNKVFTCGSIANFVESVRFEPF
jgi:hypothetical protein